MVNTIQDIENPKSIISYWNKNPNNQSNSNITEKLFDNAFNDTNLISAIFGQDQELNGLDEEALDTKVTFLNNNGFKTKPFELVYFKNAKLMNETRRNQIQQALYNNNNPGLVDAVSRTQMNDASSLLDNAKITREKMGLEAITTGKIHTKNGIVDFEVPDNHKVTVGNAWGSKDSTPLRDLKDYANFIRNDNNSVVSFAMMNTNTFNALAKSGDVIQSMGIGRLNDNFVAPDEQIKQQVRTSTNLQVLIYDKKNYLPDGKVVLIPSGSLGRMAWTNTPEEYTNGQNTFNSQVTSTRDGITLMTYRKPDPTGTIVKVSQTILPVLDKSQNIMIINTNPQTGRSIESNDTKSNENANKSSDTQSVEKAAELAQAKTDLSNAKRNLTNTQKDGDQDKIKEAQTAVDNAQAKVDELSK